MKKKLFLITLLAALFVCLFAISVSAAGEVTVITDSGTKTVDFETVFKLSDGYVAGFVDSTVYGKDNIQDVIFPATIKGFNNGSKNLFNASTVIKSITFKGTSVDMYNSENIFQNSSIESVIFEQGHDCILNAHDYTKNVFNGCTSLTTIKFPTFTKLKSDGTSDNGDALSGMFTGCTKMVAQNDIVFGEGVTCIGGQQMFENCSSLSNNAENKCDVYFPSTIVTINHRSFRNTGITALHFAENSALTTIGGGGSEGTFSSCTKLTSVDFSNCANLANLCTSLFNGCTALVSVTGLEKTAVETIPNNAFYKCSALTGTYTFPNVTTIGKEVFRYAATNEGTNLVLSFPSLVTLGGDSGDTHAFSNSGITELSFGDDIANIGNQTFTSCSRLWRVEFAGCAEGFAFKSYNFENCTALKAFSIPEGITSLPSRMFRNCSSLTAVYLPSTLTAINSGDNDSATFKNCTSLYFVSKPFTYKTLEEIPTEPEVYYFPTGLTTMTGETFDGARINDIVVFPAGLTDLSDGYTFEGSKSASGKPTVVFMGDMQSTVATKWNVSAVYFCNKADVDATSAGLTGSVTAYYCNADGNTNHLQEKIVETPATCTLNEGTHKLCFCGFVMESTDKVDGEKALGHTSKDATVVMYFPLLNGAPNYFEDAHNKYNCSRCNEEQDEVAEGTALFVGDRGYSYEENGTSVLYRLHVNVENIKAYSGAFRYGIIVSGAPSTAPITLVDGAITYGAQTLVFEMQSANYEFDYIQAKVTNIGESTLNCQAYAIDNNVVTYIGHNNVNTLAEIVTYDAIFKAYGTTSGETKEN